MKTGYVTYFMGANDLEGVKTRRMLNASISMDFQHTLRSYMTREKLELHNMIERTKEDLPGKCISRYKNRIRLPNYGLRIEKWLDVSLWEKQQDKTGGWLLNMRLNQLADEMVKEFKPSVLRSLFADYNTSSIIVRIGTKRIATT